MEHLPTYVYVALGLQILIIAVAYGLFKARDQSAPMEPHDDTGTSLPSSNNHPTHSKLWAARNRIQEDERNQAGSMATELVQKYLEYLPNTSSGKIRIRLYEPVSIRVLQRTADRLIQHGWYLKFGPEIGDGVVELYPTARQPVRRKQSEHPMLFGESW